MNNVINIASQQNRVLNRNAARYHRVINESLFRITGQLDYDRITEALTRLANYIAAADVGETDWNIGENTECDLGELFVGAYWHYTEWHGGQWSPGYAALSALGRVFNPGMTSAEPDNLAYQMLDEMAQAQYGATLDSV